MRYLGLDIHRDFCEVAIAEDGRVRSAGRIGADPASLAAFATTLHPDDVVTLEAIGNALAMARILEPHARVVLANPKAVHGITAGRAKTDRIDARALASLLAGGFLPVVWTADEPTAALRRQVTRRAGLITERTRAKNQIHAALVRNLTPRQPMSDLFGRRGLTWLAQRELPLDEREAVDAGPRQIDFPNEEIARLNRTFAAAVLASPDMQRLFTLPGVNAVTAVAFMAAVGDIARFATPRQLVSYLGLNPTVRQSGNEPARHGRISKQGAPLARHALVEAAWHAGRSAGPLRAFWQRIAAKRGVNIATVAVARKLAVIACTCSATTPTMPSRVPRWCARSCAAWNSSPAPSGTGASAPGSSPRGISIASSRNSPPKPRSPIGGSSRTGLQAGRRCGRRKRGAHLTTLSVNQRGRDEPQTLRFGSAITRTNDDDASPSSARQATVDGRGF